MAPRAVFVSEQHYVVPRTAEIADFIRRVKSGEIHRALRATPVPVKPLFSDWHYPHSLQRNRPISRYSLDFQDLRNVSPAEFYEELYYMIREQIEIVFERRGSHSF